MAAPNKNGRPTLLFRIGLWVSAMVPATLVTISGESFHLSPRAVLAVFMVSWVASYFALDWAMLERAAELKKKYPISSKELRRRTKEFYDSVHRFRG